MILVLVLLLAACATQVPTHDATFAGVADEVAQQHIVAALNELVACEGRPCDLAGWSVWYAAEESPIDHRFACSEATECGPRPPGCACDAACPCRCRGLTLVDTQQLVVTTDLTALKHELIHACYGVTVHNGTEWECQ